MTERIAILKVEGIHCQGCASTIGSALRFVKGVKDAKVDVEKKKATIRFDSEQANEAVLKKAITKAGYIVA